MLVALLALSLGSQGLGAAGLEPAFRLPIAGKPLCPLVIDDRASPALVWALSEDSNLYLLSEDGRLLAKTALQARPLGFLALDGAGRALVVVEGGSGGEGLGQGGPFLLAYTKLGRQAFKVGLEALGLAQGEVPGLLLGADDRLFLSSAKGLLCLSQNGQRLWSFAFPGALAVKPGLDGLGRPALGLADGRLIILSPYGEVEARADLGSAATALGPLVFLAYRSQDQGRAVLALGLASGELAFVDRAGKVLSKPQGGRGLASLVSDGSTLYTLGSGGSLAAWTSLGLPVWKTETGLSGASLRVYAQRLVLTAPGKALALDRQGQALKEASFANAAGASLPSPSGLLFSPGADWVLGAFPFDKALGPSLEPAFEPYGDDAADVASLMTYDPAIGSSGRRLALLAEYTASLDSRGLGALEPKAGALATALIRGDFSQGYSQAEARFRADPLPKARAMEVLGRLGSPERLPVLIQAFKTEVDPALRAAACGAIAAIGRDPQGQAGQAFAEAAGRLGAVLDDQVAYAMVGAIEALALRSGSPPSLESLRALLALTRSPHGPDVKNAATKALSRLAGSLGP